MMVPIFMNTVKVFKVGQVIYGHPRANLVADYRLFESLQLGHVKSINCYTKKELEDRKKEVNK
jgi:hypothetical protein